jgi:formylglycine-generating enzyme required for sulfatase activity
VEFATPSKVRVPAFYIDRLEVSAFEYGACVEAGACAPSKQVLLDESKPAAVLFDAARQYCAWKQKRLPTEVEWERAARGHGVRRYPWGSDAPTCEHTNLDRCNAVSDDTSRRVDRRGEHPRGASPFGVEDLAGGAPEFVDRRRSDGRVLVKGSPILPMVNRDNVAVHYGEWVESDRQRAGFRCVRDVAATSL